MYDEDMGRLHLQEVINPDTYHEDAELRLRFLLFDENEGSGMVSVSHWKVCGYYSISITFGGQKQ